MNKACSPRHFLNGASAQLCLAHGRRCDVLRHSKACCRFFPEKAYQFALQLWERCLGAEEGSGLREVLSEPEALCQVAASVQPPHALRQQLLAKGLIHPLPRHQCNSAD